MKLKPFGVRGAEIKMSVVFSMDKNWKFSVYEQERERQYKYPKLIDFYKLKSSYEDGYASPGFDDNDWRIVNLPHDAVVESDFDSNESIYHGGRTRQKYCYRKTFAVDEKYMGNQFLICFEGIACSSLIYFNGSIIKRSYSAYEEITIDVTDRIHFGKQANVIVVIADGTDFDNWSYEGGGIYRHVNLYIKNPIHIAHNGIYFNPSPVNHKKLDGKWNIATEITLENSSYKKLECDVEIAIKDATGEIITSDILENVYCNADTINKLKTNLEVENPSLWDIETPNLYIAEVKIINDGIVLDTCRANIGFRCFSFDSENGFFLNNKILKLKGFGIHSDHAGVGIAVPDSICEYRIKLLKSVGCNIYRCAHCQHPKEILDACDKYGIIVMDEARHFETSEENLQLIDNMVMRDRNHPSLFFYTVFNEEPLQGSCEGRNIYKRMESRIRKLDSSRIIIGAQNGGWFEEDGAALAMAMTGFNYSIDKIPEFHEKYPHQPLMITECTSTMATRGCYKTDPDKHVMNSMESENSYHPDIFTACRMLEEEKYIAGVISWAGFDYRGEPTPYVNYSISSQYGIMDTCGLPKTNYYYVKSCFSNEPMIQIEPHWNHSVGETVKVKVITNVAEAELFLNGKALGKKQVDRYNPPTWNLFYEPGVISAIGYLDDGTTITCKRETSDTPYAIKLLPDRTFISNNGRDAVAINVCVVDKNDVVVPYADFTVNFSVNGDAEILGVGNGDPNSREADKANYRKLYNGYAQVIIQSLENAKSICLKASADNIISDTVQFEVINEKPIEKVAETDSKNLGGLFISIKNFDEEPSTDLYMTDNEYSLLDNAFEPLILNPNRFQQFANCYKIYRTKIQLKSNEIKKCSIYIEKVQFQKLKAYANGRLVFEVGAMENEPLAFSFEPAGDTKIEFRFHIKSYEGRENSGLRGFATISVE